MGVIQINQFFRLTTQVFIETPWNVHLMKLGRSQRQVRDLIAAVP
jgi:hypothetical protein